MRCVTVIFYGITVGILLAIPHPAFQILGLKILNMYTCSHKTCSCSCSWKKLGAVVWLAEYICFMDKKQIWSNSTCYLHSSIFFFYLIILGEYLLFDGWGCTWSSVWCCCCTWSCSFTNTKAFQGKFSSKVKLPSDRFSWSVASIIFLAAEIFCLWIPLSRLGCPGKKQLIS